MKKALVFTLALALGFWSVVALAQLIPEQVVSYQTGKISWNDPAPAEGVLFHTVFCGTETGAYTIEQDVTMPATELLLSNVLPGPGIYVCSATATNIIGESGFAIETNPFAAIQSEAGGPPDVIIVGN